MVIKKIKKIKKCDYFTSFLFKTRPCFKHMHIIRPGYNLVKLFF